MKHQTPDILNQMRDRLIMAHYRLGQKLRPSEIAGDFGVSANTIREIMVRLSTEGLLDYEDQRGFRVVSSSDRLLHDITEFRIVLEKTGVERSIARGGIEWEAQMTAAHHKLSHIENRIRRTGDVVGVLKHWSDAELDFHLSLMGAAEMPVLRQNFRTIYARFRQQIVSPDRSYAHRDGNIVEHQRILEAALDRDVAASLDAIHSHLCRNLLPTPDTAPRVSEAG
ncbi:MAG: transcriptional regulator [Maritimibacter sp.]|nr:transcriptional regulator [Maritimibacter sp.]